MVVEWVWVKCENAKLQRVKCENVCENIFAFYPLKKNEKLLYRIFYPTPTYNKQEGQEQEHCKSHNGCARLNV